VEKFEKWCKSADGGPLLIGGHLANVKGFVSGIQGKNFPGRVGASDRRRLCGRELYKKPGRKKGSEFSGCNLL